VLSLEGIWCAAAKKPPLASARRTLRDWDSPLPSGHSSRGPPSHRPGSAPSSGRPFAPPSGSDAQSATPRLGRAKTAVPRLLLQNVITVESEAEGSEPEEDLPASEPASAAAHSHSGALNAHSHPEEQPAGVQEQDSGTYDGENCSESESELTSACTTARHHATQEVHSRRASVEGCRDAARAPFQFSGDLDADVEALEALEGYSTCGDETDRCVSICSFASLSF
jgi:hypothetical protein